MGLRFLGFLGILLISSAAIGGSIREGMYELAGTLHWINSKVVEFQLFSGVHGEIAMEVEDLERRDILQFDGVAVVIQGQLQQTKGNRLAVRKPKILRVATFKEVKRGFLKEP